MPIWLFLFLKNKTLTSETYYEIKEEVNELKRSYNTKTSDKIILNFVYYGMKIRGCKLLWSFRCMGLFLVYL
jgi:hypothetical protein